MYEYIKGRVISATPAAIVVEAGGVGYLMNTSLQTSSELSGKEEALVWVHHVVREDAHLFFGFATQAERELFRMLITVPGIGANTARIILSACPADNLATIIATGDTASLKSIKGIGAKTAERIVLDLKGKVMGGILSDTSVSGFHAGKESPMEEAIAALMVLGFTRAATEKTVRGIYSKNPSILAEDLIRESLTKL